ncbi:MAG TPA: hypothetical protein VLA54_01620, partial [Acidimicrobiia bacterium]|nr:hypothetical protein [Acidimicrobiia bacterium]
RAGLRTVVVDADFLSHRATAMLSPFTSGGPETGLSEVVTGRARLNNALAPGSLGGRFTIDVLRRGGGNMSWTDLLTSTQAARVFEDLRARYDLVVVDTAPLLQVPEARAALQIADFALPVVRHRDLAESFEELLIRLNLVGVPVLGYVYVHTPRLSQLVDTA